jgi:hypothetical protein
MAVRIDEPGEKALALQIDAFSLCRCGFLHLGKAAHRENLVAANCNRLRIRILRIAGEDFRMKENSFPGTLLRTKEGARQEANKRQSQEKDKTTPE